MSSQVKEGSFGVKSVANEEFWVTSGYKISTLLHLQHYLLNTTIKDIIPTSLDLSQPLRIADLACGNGIWLNDEATSGKYHPDTIFYGSDINPPIFPHKQWLPRNVTLTNMNALKPEDIPKELVGSFDFVHARWLCSAFPGGDPDLFLRVASKLLKRGGVLRWEENKLDEVPVRAPDGVEKGATEKIGKVLAGTYAGKVIQDSAFEDWSDKYDLTIRSNKPYHVPDHLLKAVTECQLQVLEAHTANQMPSAADLKASGKEGMSKEEFGEVLKEAIKECSNGVAIHTGSHFILEARKE